MPTQRGRRRFLKSSGAIVAGTAIAGSGRNLTLTGTLTEGCDKGPGLAVTRPDPTPYLVDERVYQRFSAASTRFNQTLAQGVDLAGLIYSNSGPRIERGEPGFSRFDLALLEAARHLGVTLSFAQSPYDLRLESVGFSYADARPDPAALYPRLADLGPEQASAAVKRAARFLGADLAGVCRLDPRWLYSENWLNDKRDTQPLRLPGESGWVVVLGFTMDQGAVATSPSALAAAATALGYSRMNAVSLSLAAFIKSLGFQAIACGNDTALSVPLAIDAGLGEISRMGMLVTPEFGPRVRLAKVITDLPLAADHPVSFGVRAFCGKCKKCARSCPASAIPLGEPTWSGPAGSTNPGVLKWYCNPGPCLDNWCRNGVDCMTCVAVCPYSLAGRASSADLADMVGESGARAWVPPEESRRRTGRNQDAESWWGHGAHRSPQAAECYPGHHRPSGSPVD